MTCCITKPARRPQGLYPPGIGRCRSLISSLLQPFDACRRPAQHIPAGNGTLGLGRARGHPTLWAFDSASCSPSNGGPGAYHPTHTRMATTYKGPDGSTAKNPHETPWVFAPAEDAAGQGVRACGRWCTGSATVDSTVCCGLAIQHLGSV